MKSELKNYYIENKYVMNRFFISFFIVCSVLFFSIFIYSIIEKAIMSSKNYLDKKAIYVSNYYELDKTDYNQSELIKFYNYSGNYNGHRYHLIEINQFEIIKELASLNFYNDRFDGLIVSKEFIKKELNIINPKEAIGVFITYTMDKKVFQEQKQKTFEIVNYYEENKMPFNIKRSGLLFQIDDDCFNFIPKLDDDEIMINAYGYIFKYDNIPVQEQVNQIAIDNNLSLNENEIYTYYTEVNFILLIFDPIIKSLTTIANSLILISILIFIFSLILVLNITKHSVTLRYLLGAKKSQLIKLKLVFYLLFLGVIVTLTMFLWMLVFVLISKANNISFSLVIEHVFYKSITWVCLMILGICLTIFLTNKQDVILYIR